MNDLEKWVISEMIDKLENYEGVGVYLSDLAYILFENENANGSYTCSTYKARLWCQQYFECLGDAVEDYSHELGEPPANVFMFPERFQLQIIIYLADKLMTTSSFILANWDSDEMTLTREIIDTIIKEWQEAMEL